MKLFSAYHGHYDLSRYHLPHWVEGRVEGWSQLGLSAWGRHSYHDNDVMMLMIMMLLIMNMIIIMGLSFTFSLWLPRILKSWRHFANIHSGKGTYQNIAKGTTDPRVEFISQVQTQILIKFHLQNLDQTSTSKSQPNINLSIKLKLQNLDQT